MKALILSLLFLSSIAFGETLDGRVVRLAEKNGYIKALQKITGIYDISVLFPKANETGLTESLINMMADLEKEIKNGGPIVVAPPVVIPPTQPTDKSFWSVHQEGLKIALQPPAGTYNYSFAYPVGFKAQYNPDDVGGCVMGFKINTSCAFPSMGSYSLPEFTQYKLAKSKFKVYVPPGTKELRFGGYYPQGTKAAFAIKYGAPPVKASINDAEYAQAQVNEKVTTAFPRIIAGEEIIVVHDGGGSMRFLAGAVPAIDKGGWVYFTQLSGSYMYDVQGGVDLDLEKFRAGYQSIPWDSSGDPQ